MLGLKSATDPEWTKTALSNEGALLHDHAHLERKAAGNALTLVGQLPDHAPEILEVVHEELEHFERVCGLLEKRNLPLGPDTGNPYVKQLTEVGGRRRLLDRLLKMGLVEARSFERFSLLAAAASGDLTELYRDLQESEAGHHVLFVKLAYSKFPRDVVQKRWDELATAEAEIVANTPWGPRIH
ncbi:MAG: tRNA isopentenyl-2-thiomethyl-A-37 hydroxylase MiaE [Planctomycetota bacterium]